MRASILALTSWIGAGVILGCLELRKEKHHAVQSVPVVGRLVETPARREAETRPPEAPARDGAVRMKVTAYCCCRICCEKFSGGGKTSIGKDANQFDGVAADPRLLPYHTKLEIPGIGIREVDDTGGAMRQDAKQGIVHIDVRMASHSAARQWGARWLEVKILK